MLQDIIDEYDIDSNFDYLLGRYILYLGADGKFKHSAPRSKTNFRSRLKKLHNEGETEGPIFTRFNEWIQNQMFRAQKSVERDAAKIGGNWEEKYNKLKEDTDKEIASLKAELKLENEKRIKLLEECDSDSD